MKTLLINKNLFKKYISDYVASKVFIIKYQLN
jgi:hypothetical protein